MLYSDYKEKLDKRRAIFAKLWKFRLLFLALFILLVAAFILMGLVGSIYSERYSDEIVYGESLSPVSKAIFADVKYEFKVDGKWTETEPLLSGEYEFRTVSHGLAGRKKCGNPHPYTILRADVHINIQDTPIVYGENPKYDMALCYGDIGYVTKFDFSRTAPDAFAVSADVESVSITNEKGEDVTFCYNLIADTEQILTRPRSLTIRTGSQTWTYDGETHACEEFEVTEGKLLDGHSLTVSLAMAKNVGVYPNAPISYKILDCDGADMTCFYDLKAVEGTLKIERRPLVLRTIGKSFVYDGLPHSCGEFEVVDGLVDGHVISGNPAEPLPTLIDVGSLENRFSVAFTVFDGDEDVTDNYETQFLYGTVSVIKRRVSITTGSKTFVYDGKPHACFDFELDAPLPSGHSAVPSCEGFTDITDDEKAGFIDNVLSFSIVDGDRDVTDNYELKISYGKLRIKSPIVVELHAMSKHYDGTPLSFEGDEFTLKTLPPDVGDVRITLVGSLTEAGSLDVAMVRELSEVELIGAEGENRVDFVCDSDPLTVYKRELEVTSISIFEKKGSAPLYGNVSGAAWISFGSLLDGHTIAISVTGKLELDRQSTVNTIASIKISYMGKDVTSNYDVRLNEGTLAWL